MKIYAIWKYTDQEQKIIESAYCNKFVEGDMNALKEHELLQNRQENTEQNSYITSAVDLKEFNSYKSLSFHSNEASSFLKGCCLIVGSQELDSLPDLQKYFLIKNILEADNSLADIMQNPEKHAQRLVYASPKKSQANQIFITHRHDLNKPSDLSNAQKSGTTFFIDPRYPDEKFNTQQELLDFEQELVKLRAEQMQTSFCFNLFPCLT